MNKSISILLTSIFCLYGCSIIDEYGRTMSTKKFMEQATYSSLYEISLGDLALQKATDSEVLAFAELMISEHTKANNELAVLASHKEIPLPDTMDVNRQAAYLSISQDPPIVFDKKYIDAIMSNHNSAIAKYDSASKFVEDGEVRDWAARQIPVLKSHLERARELDVHTNDL